MTKTKSNGHNAVDKVLDATTDVLDQVQERNDARLGFFKGIGITPEPDMEWPVFEDNYIKFMSKGGYLDHLQGDQFQAWLNSQGLPVERLTPRAFNLGRDATARLVDIVESLRLTMVARKMVSKLEAYAGREPAEADLKVMVEVFRSRELFIPEGMFEPIFKFPW